MARLKLVLIWKWKKSPPQTLEKLFLKLCLAMDELKVCLKHKNSSSRSLNLVLKVEKRLRLKYLQNQACLNRRSIFQITVPKEK